MIGITNVGGGNRNNGEELYAAISAEYPQGSVCTLKSKSYPKTIKAKDTSGKALFAVPYADTWTLKSENPLGQVATTDIVISEESQVEIAQLAYNRILVDGWNYDSTLAYYSAGIPGYGGGTTPEIAQTEFPRTAGRNERATVYKCANGGAIWYTKVDAKPFTKLCADIAGVLTNSSLNLMLGFWTDYRWPYDTNYQASIANWWNRPNWANDADYHHYEVLIPEQYKNSELYVGIYGFYDQYIIKKLWLE